MTHIGQRYPREETPEDAPEDRVYDAAEAARRKELLDIVFDGPPGPEGPRFVEVEIDGRSVKAGEWIKRPDGFWVLRIAR